MTRKEIFAIHFKTLLVIFLSAGLQVSPAPRRMSKFELPPVNYSNKRFNEWTWLTAHNAHLNWHDSEVIYIASNQNLSLDEQLKAGVRGFMFDIDHHECSYFEHLLNTCKCEGICLCHGQCSAVNLKDGFSRKPLSYALKKLVNFLTRNKNEIVTVFFEDYIRQTIQLTSLFDRISDLKKLLFNPHEWDVHNNGWPKISDMIRADKRLVIVDDEQRAWHADELNGIVRVRDYFIQNHHEWTVEKNSSSNYVVTPKFKLTNLLDKNYTKTLIKEGKDNVTLSIPIARCFSVYKAGAGPNWGENNELDLESREHANQLMNNEKLFLFNHFYGVPAKAVLDGNTQLYEHINSKDFIMKRLREKCDPLTNAKRPNFIALDFIDYSIYHDLIVPLNKNGY